MFFAKLLLLFLTAKLLNYKYTKNMKNSDILMTDILTKDVGINQTVQQDTFYWENNYEKEKNAEPQRKSTEDAFISRMKGVR